MMKRTCGSWRHLLLALLLAALVMADEARAGRDDGRLDIYWVDVEGGAATLVVTPAGESLLIDAGNPGERDASRIEAAARAAGLERIDHLVVTHFHIDHFGGIAELARRMPLGVVYDNGVASAPENERKDARLADYLAAPAGRRVTLEPGMKLPLRQSRAAARLSVRVIATRQKIVGAGRARPNRVACGAATRMDPDPSDNANSAVTLLELGRFRFFDGGDLTWNVEQALVCPHDRVGAVDVLQSNHHGLDVSNNPVLLAALSPTVTVFNNGSRKGCGAKSFQAVRALASTQAIFQVHKNLRDDRENNTDDSRIANHAAECKGNTVKLSVAPNGAEYTVSIPASGYSQTFKTRAGKIRSR